MQAAINYPLTVHGRGGVLYEDQLASLAVSDETFLDEKRLLSAKSPLCHTCARQYWQERIDGRHNWQYLLWDVLMLESRRERWG
jgi:hypothetical protein